MSQKQNGYRSWDLSASDESTRRRVPNAARAWHDPDDLRGSSVHRAPRSAFGRSLPPWVLPLVVVIVLLVAVAVAASTCQGCSQQPSQPVQPVAEEGVRTVEEAVAAGGTAADGGSAVQTSFAAYGFDELKHIAQEIASSGSEEAALSVAQKYRLMNDEGKLTGDRKPFELADGSAATLQIAGFYHDDKTDGGKTGITFIMGDCLPTKAAMNASGNNSYGWAYSDMRASLALSSADWLPADVSGKIVPVSKTTNNVGASESDDVLSTTSDAVWLYSKTELVGEIPETEQTRRAVLTKEGTQYQLFAENGVVHAEDNRLLEKQCNGEFSIWWTRSSVLGLESGFYAVLQTGNSETSSYFADNEYGVVPGFCF